MLTTPHGSAVLATAGTVLDAAYASWLCDRVSTHVFPTDYWCRGVQRRRFPDHAHKSPHTQILHRSILIAQVCDAEALRKVFVAFASFAVRVAVEDLDGAKFSKLCKDAKLLGYGLTAIEVDIVFAKVKVAFCTVFIPLHSLNLPERCSCLRMSLQEQRA